jgi:glutaredoxin 3
MGRITIFSLDDCPHCKRVKHALDQYKIPYTEINMSEHPYKRNDLVTLLNYKSNRNKGLTVPQIFLNDSSLGGVHELLALLDEWQETGNVWNMYQQKVKQEPDPVDTLLDPPITTTTSTTSSSLSTLPGRRTEQSPPRDQSYSIVLPNGTRTTVFDMTEALLQMLPRKPRKYNTTVYNDCFTGTEAVQVFQDVYHISTTQAIQLGCQLQNAFLLAHVTEEHAFDNRDYFFRLRCEQTPWILNSYCIWTERVDPDAMRLLRSLKTVLGTIQMDQTDAATGTINYKDSTVHPLYPRFQEAVCELQKIDYVGLDAETKMVRA